MDDRDRGLPCRGGSGQRRRDGAQQRGTHVEGAARLRLARGGMTVGNTRARVVRKTTCRHACRHVAQRVDLFRVVGGGCETTAGAQQATGNGSGWRG